MAAMVLASIAAVFSMSIASVWVYKFLNASARFRYAATGAAILAAAVTAVVVARADGPGYLLVLYPGVAFSVVMFAAWRVHAVFDAMEILRR